MHTMHALISSLMNLPLTYWVWGVVGVAAGSLLLAFGIFPDD